MDEIQIMVEMRSLQNGTKDIGLLSNGQNPLTADIQELTQYIRDSGVADIDKILYAMGLEVTSSNSNQRERVLNLPVLDPKEQRTFGPVFTQFCAVVTAHWLGQFSYANSQICAKFGALISSGSYIKLPLENHCKRFIHLILWWWLVVVIVWSQIDKNILQGADVQEGIVRFPKNSPNRY